MRFGSLALGVLVSACAIGTGDQPNVEPKAPDAGAAQPTTADAAPPTADGSPDPSQSVDAAPSSTSPDAAPVSYGARVVLAGDSWSTGLIGPLRDSLDANGFTATELSYEFTANAGSTAAGWVANEHPPAVGGGVDTGKPRMLDALGASLDASPTAGALVLVIGGNDLNREADAGIGELPSFLAALRYDVIQADIQALVDAARAGRPQLRIVLVGYDYMHFEFLVAFGLSLDGFDTRTYNEAFLELGRRKRLVAANTPNVEYANNYGLLQHVYGDTIHPPFSIPNPLTGHPEYAAGVAPAPGLAPSYEAGGFITYPAPLAYMPDGIHPSATGFRTIIDHVMDQGLANWLTGGAFTPSP